ncbi:DUF4394 domain-containing protein [Kineococcus sp. NUM-3379]
MRKSVKMLAVTASAAALAFGAVPAASATGGGSAQDSGVRGLHAVGLVGGTELVRFHLDDTKRLRTTGTVSGLTGGDTRLVGIDYRVQDGKLYGVGDKGGIYTLTDSGAATFVQRLTVALQGTAFGVDFNPAANALRVVSDTGQNLRQPFATAGAATVADTPLSTPPAAGPTAGVTAAAYTNNDTDAATGTTLYDLNTATDTLALQAPANAGTLSTVGSLKVDATGDAGFDIFSRVKDGSTVDVHGFATLSVGGKRALYGVNLFTGKVSKTGDLAKDVTDIAVQLRTS